MLSCTCSLGVLAIVAALEYVEGPADKGGGLPERTVEIVVDLDSRFINDEFGGDAAAAIGYVSNVLLAVEVILKRDLNVSLDVEEIVAWENPAPFELDESGSPSFVDVFGAYFEYVKANRAASLPSVFQLITGGLSSFAGLRSLASVSDACGGASALVADVSTSFPPGPGAIDVILSARGLGRNLGAATNTAEPSVMGATIGFDTPLLFLPESIAAIGERLAVGDCWAPATGEGEGEVPPHSADQDGDNTISLSELLRVIQFYNSDRYGCDAGGEDGFAPNATDESCAPHASDYNPQDWEIALSELLRLIQFYNSGGYHPCPEGEDGYCPGA